MGNKKNIDRLFQEQFKDFHQAPDKRVWEKISKSLETTKVTKNKRMLPFWMQLSGIAATILLLISFGISQYKATNIAPTIVDTPTSTIIDTNIVIKPNVNVITQKNTLDSSIKEILNTDKQKNKKTNSSTIISSNNKTIASQQEETQNFNTPTNSTNNNTISNQQTIASTTNKTREQKFDNQKLKTNDNFNQNNIVSKNRNNLSTRNKQNQLTVSNVENEYIQQQNTLSSSNKTKKHITNNDEIVSKNSSKENEFHTKSSVEKTNFELNNNNTTVVQNSEKINIEEKRSTINMDSVNSTLESRNKTTTTLNTEKTKEKENINRVIATQETTEDEVESKSENINEVIATQKVPEDEKEIIATQETTEDEVESEKESINEAIAIQEDKEETSEELTEIKKWNIATNIAPVYYNSLSNGSPIDNQFSDNKKKGEFNTSYGINVSYAINNRLSFRTGVHKLELGYDTQDVAVLPANSSSGSTNIGLKGLDAAPGVSLNISNANSFTVSQIPSGYSSLFDSSLSQRLGYIEVPLEIGYRISDKKMKINIIAGMSTFFLNKNEIYSETNGIKTYLGSGNNLNNTSFSTNLGVGFDYKLSKHLNFNLEPMFKYQVNSFNKDVDGFRPYILGMYTGFSYKF